MEGIIKDFDSIRKFGHISYEGDKLMFVHISAFKAFIKANELSALAGKAVRFAIGEYNGRPTAQNVEIMKPEEPEEPADLTDLVPYDEQVRLERMAKRQRRHISECYVGDHSRHNERKERQRKLSKILDDAFDDYND